MATSLEDGMCRSSLAILERHTMQMSYMPLLVVIHVILHARSDVRSIPVPEMEKQFKTVKTMCGCVWIVSRCRSMIKELGADMC